MADKIKKVKSPIEKLMVSSLGEPFYLNVVLFENDNRWFPIFESKWAGSTHKLEAVKLRKEAQVWLKENGSKKWTEKNFKTVKVTLYK